MADQKIWVLTDDELEHVIETAYAMGYSKKYSIVIAGVMRHARDIIPDLADKVINTIENLLSRAGVD